MHSNNIKELFNKAYIRAISAQAGYQCKEYDLDLESEDLIVCGHGFSDGAIENPEIAFQLKATSRRNTIKKDHIIYQLKSKNYNDLRKTNILKPRYLAVMLLPNKKSDWIEHGFMASTIRRDCFYISLAGSPPLKDKDSITIKIPLKNKLNADVIKKLLADASKRGIQ